jgi:hypothetical protein
MSESLKRNAIFLLVALFVIALSEVPSFAASATITEGETASGGDNSDITVAKIVSVSVITGDSDYVMINGGFFDASDTADFYKITPKANYQGQLAIRLSFVPSNSYNNYNIELLDENGDRAMYGGTGQYPNKGSNSKEMVKTSETNGLQPFYIKVTPVSIYQQDYSSANYKLEISRFRKANTITQTLSPTTLNSTSNVWSPDATYNGSVIPAADSEDSKIISATVEALKHATVLNTSNNTLRAKIGNSAYQEVTWASGPRQLTDFAGMSVKATWAAGFWATELPVLVNNKSTYLGIVSMNTFKMSVTYQYDKYPKSQSPYSSELP